MASDAAALPPADSFAPPGGEFLFEMIVSELHGSALQIGALCLLVDSRSSLRQLTQDDARAARLALRYGETAGLSAETAKRIDQFYVEVAEMQAQLGPFDATEHERHRACCRRCAACRWPPPPRSAMSSRWSARDWTLAISTTAASSPPFWRAPHAAISLMSTDSAR